MSNENESSPPAADEIEVSLFGPGYGECLVAHLGAGEWIVVDSCTRDRSSVPVALEYFDRIGVDPDDSVRLVVATHWHDDHIRGLAQVVEAAPRALFACSAAFGQRDFVTLVEATRVGLMTSSSGVDEFRRILSGSTTRASKPAFVIGERLLYRGARSEVTSLTPSDAAFRAAMADIARALPNPRAPKQRITSLNPNHSSVVLWVRVDTINLLLGADLQEVPGHHWTAVVDSSTRPLGKASAVKIAHHGASNGDHPPIWTEMVYPEPLSVVSPFSRGRTLLPAAADYVRICSRSPISYITAPPQRPRAPRRDATVDKTIREAVGSLTLAIGPSGQVRARAPIGSAPPAWNVQTFGAAHALCS